MPYYEEVVIDYLQADRQFVQREYLLTLDKSSVPLKGRHWFVDAVSLDFKTNSLWLCEVSYAKNLYGLRTRLVQWSKNWDALCLALHSEISIGKDWTVRPWIFTPEYLKTTYQPQLCSAGLPLAFEIRWTSLEEVTPWRIASMGKQTG